MPESMSQRQFDGWWERWERGEWEPNSKKLIEEVLGPDKLFVDVGAWIGPLSRWAQEQGAKVVAIEPDPYAINELDRVVPEAEIIQGALVPSQPGFRQGTEFFMANPHNRFGDSTSTISDDGEMVVRGFTLPHILHGREPSLVSIDVEGYEEHLLPTVGPQIAEMNSVLLLELHGEKRSATHPFQHELRYFDRIERDGKHLVCWP